MRATVLLFFLTIFVCVLGATPAQQRVDQRTDESAKKSGQKLSEDRSSTETQPQPGPEIDRLVKAFSGTWSIAIRIEPSEKMPKGGSGQGEEVWRPGPSGLSLIEEYHSTGDEGELSGLGVAWWEKDTQRYQVMWCASGNPQGCISMKHGAKWEGKQVAVEDESENAGKRFKFKEVFADITENSFTQTLYQSESGSDFKRLLTIVATRKTPALSQADFFTPRSSELQVQSLKMPGPAVQNSMLGRWSLTLKYEPSPERPHGATGMASEVWWAGPGEYSVVEEYYQNDANEHVQEFIPNWWDSKAEGQRFLYCSNTLPEGCQLSKNVAKWVGERNVYTEEREEGGKPMIVQEIFEDISPNSFTQILKEGESGKALKTTLTMHATRLFNSPQ